MVSTVPDNLSKVLEPVFLEPRDDYWEMHVPENVSMDDRRVYQLSPRASAKQLENVIYCEDCFPDEESEGRG